MTVSGPSAGQESVPAADAFAPDGSAQASAPPSSAPAPQTEAPQTEAAGADAPPTAATAVADPLAPPAETVIRTENTGLHDGVNRCPKCGSTDVQLRASTGSLICLFCRAEWSEERVEEKFGLGDGLADLSGTVIGSGAANIDASAAPVLTFKCGGCGAEVVINVDSALAARCHWCRHVLTVNEQIPNGAVPDAVLPFAVTHDQAVEAIRQFAGARRTFANRRFTEEFTPENVVGVYLPYMIVDANTQADLHGVGEIETRRYTRGEGDNRQTYYDADVYRVQRQLQFTVDDLPIESSAERADFNPALNTNNILNAILPFDTKNAVQWNAAYLSGFTSEKRDLDVDALRPRVEEELLSIARSQAESTIGAYNRGVRWEQEGVHVHGTRWVAMYLPVWLYSHYFEENGRGMVHYIAVNARNGTTMGSIPLARGKLLAMALAIGLVVEIVAVPIMIGLGR